MSNTLYFFLPNRNLNQLRKEKILATVFLTNGFQLRGRVVSFDNFTVLLDVEGKQQLVFKHAISTFSPQKNVALNPDAE
ncbi:RNA chaperone Hfq [Listeria monocytogenes]|nr:RNA chaperone Hfq [Listeria monocytogenes]